jgi:hypothetical protein
MELAILRSLMDKEFYDDHRGAKCPDRIFSTDGKKIKKAIDAAMENYGRAIQPDEIEAVFMADNPSMTTAQKTAFSALFDKIRNQTPMGSDVAQDVFVKMFRQVVGEDIANLGFDYVNGDKSSLEPLRELLDRHQDNFLPQLRIEWEDLSLDSLLAKNALETRWAFNIPTLTRKVPGINGGHLLEIGARPNTGKTSFHASLVCGPGGFVDQGAKCAVLCNEEGAHRVGSRYLTAALGRELKDIADNKQAALQKWEAMKERVYIVDSTGKDMSWVESLAKTFKPDILVLDMGDKFAKTGGFARMDEALKANAIYARQIAKMYDCAVLYMSQLSAEAENKVVLNQSMMEGSRTGKAAEADLMVLIAKNPPVEGQDEEDTQRHLNIVKNKLTGWHGIVHCDLDYKVARYVA